MPKPFTDFLRELRYGRAVEEANDMMTEVVAAVKATGRPGKLTLTISFQPPKKGGINYIEVVDDLRAKIPAPDKPSSIFFPTSDNGLSRQDQQQQVLALGSVDRETGEIIDVVRESRG